MPGLLTLKTDLKSLKYGQDTPGGGNSGQPYIKTDINTVDRGFNQFRLTKFDDGLVRGGIIGATNASVVDTLRIGKFFVDFPKGPLFLVKQVGLQLSNPQLEHINTLPTNRTGTNRPTRGQGFLNNVGNFFTNTATSVGAFITNTANRIENEVGPTRIYNLGINTLAQVPLNAVGGHILRHGFLPVNDTSKLYINVVTKNNFQNEHNRLEKYASKFNLGGMAASPTFVGPPSNNPFLPEITNYLGGPDSVYGIVSTRIGRYVYTNNTSKIQFSVSQSQIFAGKTRDNNDGGPQSAKIVNTKDYGLSNKTESRYSDREFLDLSGSVNPNFTFYDFTATVNDKSQSFAGYTRQNNNVHETVKIVNSADYGLSNKTNSIFVSQSFNLTGSLNSNSSFLFYTASNNDKPQIFAGKSHQTDQPETVKIVNSVDYEISLKTGSIFTTEKLKISTPISSSSFLFYVANNNDRKNHVRDSNLPALQSKNDLVKNGPSSHPEVTGSKIASLSLQNTVYDYSSPSIKTYEKIKNRINNGNNITHQNYTTQPVVIARGNASYQYNKGLKNIAERKNDRNIQEDQIKVIFAPINPFTSEATDIQFLAYIANYSEDYQSGWSDVKYAGRAENFYIFNSFKRTVNISLQVPCFNETELELNHKKLFTLGGKGLAYALAGQYTDSNLMGGVITKLTVGNYIVDSPGIINSLKFDIIEGSSWDLDKQYAFYLKIDIAFTVIGNKLPMYDGITVIPTPVTPPIEDPLEKEDIPVDIPKITLDPVYSDYTGQGAGFETSQGRTDVQKRFMEARLDAILGL